MNHDIEERDGGYEKEASFFPYVTLRHIQFEDSSPIIKLKIQYPLFLEIKEKKLPKQHNNGDDDDVCTSTDINDDSESYPSQLSNGEEGDLYIEVWNRSLIDYGVSDITNAYLKLVVDPQKLEIIPPHHNNNNENYSYHNPSSLFLSLFSYHHSSYNHYYHYHYYHHHYHYSYFYYSYFFSFSIKTSFLHHCAI